MDEGTSSEPSFRPFVCLVIVQPTVYAVAASHHRAAARHVRG